MSGQPVGKGPPTPSWDLKETAAVRRQIKETARTPLKPKNEKRKGERFPELRDPDRLAWTRKEPCIISGKRAGEWIPAAHGFQTRRAFIEAAHMRSRGAAGDDSSALPVDKAYHREQHQIGIRTWAKKYGLDLPALIAAANKKYALHLAEKAKSSEAKK